MDNNTETQKSDEQIPPFPSEGTIPEKIAWTMDYVKGHDKSYEGTKNMRTGELYTPEEWRSLSIMELLGMRDRYIKDGFPPDKATALTNEYAMHLTKVTPTEQESV